MNPSRRHTLAALGALGAMTVLPGVAFAQAYPSKPIRLIVPYPAGGGTDSIARLVAVRMAENLKANIVVENKPGAGGVVGNDMVAKSPADGYTLLIGITVLVQHPALLEKVPYDVMRDFYPVGVIARSADLFMVHADVPVSNVAEFVALAKSNPKDYALGSYGNGTSSHVHAAMLNKQAGLDLPVAHYKGAAPLINDLMAGHVRAGFVDSSTATPHLASGRVKVLAVTGARSSPLAPNVPTFTQLGYKSFEPYGWFGMFAPAGVPAPIAKRLSDELAVIVAHPDVRKRLQEMGLQPGGGSQEEWAREMRHDLEVWGKVIRDASIRIE